MFYQKYYIFINFNILNTILLSILASKSNDSYFYNYAFIKLIMKGFILLIKCYKLCILMIALFYFWMDSIY